ncbi:glycosyltransferase family 4 protein [uncultured Roseivirga sp.]|uniref:glycosyltransferase family 4 protein n=1 Tax=uncultured Roseivirga sp. TaxID=543088 RepID=UPI0030D6F32D|tara:strand:- start:6538 stop:7692 length:1155 start_codon:yes stop_codon:yes gene_type:complete
MKVLQVHNIYQGKTGEETVVEEEKKILERHGHTVIQYIKDNSDLDRYSSLDKLRLLGSLHSSKSIGKELGEFIEREKPDVCHVHNTFPLITPIVYEICKSKNLPVVQTLHNYKMVCTNSLLFRNGEVCEACLNKSLYNSIKFKCYRDSYLATAAQAHVIQHHRNIGTWDNLIDRYVCLTEFQKEKVFGGSLRGKVVVKPNFLAENNLETVRENFFLFVGRLNDSKGLQDLLYLFRRNSHSNFVLIGKSDNPEIFSEFKNVKHLGERNRDVVLENMRKCKAVIFPSKYYEGMPMVILEAFSLKKPVISRNRGAMASMINDKINGLKYELESELISAVDLMENKPELVNQLGEQAYKDYKAKYTEEKGYENLINLYSEVLSTRSLV